MALYALILLPRSGCASSGVRCGTVATRMRTSGLPARALAIRLRMSAISPSGLDTTQPRALLHLLFLLVLLVNVIGRWR